MTVRMCGVKCLVLGDVVVRSRSRGLWNYCIIGQVVHIVAPSASDSPSSLIWRRCKNREGNIAVYVIGVVYYPQHWVLADNTASLPAHCSRPWNTNDWHTRVSQSCERPMMTGLINHVSILYCACAIVTDSRSAGTVTSFNRSYITFYSWSTVANGLNILLIFVSLSRYGKTLVEIGRFL